jgi:hypothetical protein
MADESRKLQLLHRPACRLRSDLNATPATYIRSKLPLPHPEALTTSLDDSEGT